jgi:hypothetical protein
LDQAGVDVRQCHANLLADQGFDIDAFGPSKKVLFPEMDETADVPEITTACWGILDKAPNATMWSSSRMIVKRKGDATARVIA